MASRLIIDRIKEAVDVEVLLGVLGFDSTKAGMNDVRSRCLIHGGDNPTAFSIRTDLKLWRCYTKSCELDSSGNYSNDVISLVMKVNNISFYQALKFLSDLFNVPIDDENISEEEFNSYRTTVDTKRFTNTITRINKVRGDVPSVISEDVVLSYIFNRDGYFINKGFSKETLDKFEIGAKKDIYGTAWATIPIRDAFGNLVSVSNRRTNGDQDPRYILEEDFEKSRVLYNLNNALVLGEQTIIIVEGFKAAWAVVEAGFENVVACMGAKITKDQINLLIKSNFRNCVLMFDGDEAGLKGMLSASELLKKYFKVSTAYLPDNVSPDDLPREDLKQFLQMYVELI